MAKRDIVPNRIFLAYQWHIYRPIYEKICQELHRKYPVYFYALGRPAGQPAEALFEKIKSVLRSSTAAVFDASRGNANVSLEYGLADSLGDLQTYLVIDQHTLPNQVNVGTPIISDLAGATQNRWSINDENSLRVHLETIASNHAYTKRFKKYCRNRKMQGAQYRAPLKVIRQFDERDFMLRRELIDQLQAEWRSKSEADIVKLIGDLHKAGLITVTPGREWASKVYIA